MKYYHVKLFNCRTILIFLLINISQISCEKYLEERSSKSLVIPSSVKELQGLLDFGQMYTGYPSGGHIADDNFFLSDDNFALISTEESRNYIWDSEADISRDWQGSYLRIFDAGDR